MCYKPDLHSNLVIFKFALLRQSINLSHNLHSNLVIFKFASNVVTESITIRFTFQSGDIQINSNSEFCRLSYSIYIPIWWYSNSCIRPKAQAIGKILFTFQSGDIQIEEKERRARTGIRIYIPIWWYSNYCKCDCNKNLHSNLVIFKYVLARCIIIVVFLFTFQSGDIQMSVAPLNFLIIPIFTFQSGDIQIYKTSRWSLWSIRFTFQSGDIQIIRQHKYNRSTCNLHSNLVIFK